MGTTAGILVRRFTTICLALACAVVALAAPSARADDVWRLAGTFNNWSLTDETNTMEPSPGRDGVFVLERPWDVGSYKFKFVKNGDWAAGHFGAAAAPGALAQPGEDITLDIPVHGVFRITLFPNASSWTFEVTNVDRPYIDARVRGVPITGRPFVLDLRKSLLPLPHEQYDLDVTDPGRVVRVSRAVDRSLMCAVTPFRTGTQRFEVVLVDSDGVEIRHPLVVWVDERYGYHLMLVDADGKVMPRTRNDEQFESVGPRLHRVLLELDQPATARELVVRYGLQEVAVERDVKIAPGTYVIEVKEGTLRRRPIDEAAGGSTLLIPGNWTRFTYSPPSEDVTHETVHLIGDFNDWAMPGTRGAIEMASRADGRFITIIDLPEGAHRYAFVVDGKTIVPDTTNPDRAPFRGQDASVINVGPAAKEFGKPESRMINGDAIRHDPRSTRDIEGISADLGLADISVRTLAGDADSAAVQIQPAGTRAPGDRIHVPMRRVSTESGFDRWSARVMVGGPKLTYAFEFTDADFGHITPDYTATIGADPLQIPDWAMGAVWYQIFAERFRNGNPLNDPRGPDVYPTPWNADWYKPTPQEIAAHRVRYKMKPDEPLTPPTPYDNLFHVVWDRRYGGDLQGVVEKLDDLADLGITAIYLNPVFEAQSMHKYDATDYRHIDDNFGTPADAGKVPDTFAAPSSDLQDPETWGWTPADRYFIDVLLPAAKERGIRIVIDGVFNHTGRLFPAFQDILERGAASPYAGWFFAEFAKDGSIESWTAWDGPSGWLPKFKQNADRSLVAPVEKHIFDITRRWMDPNGDGDPADGIDGWRLDVPLDVGLPFWERWRTLVKSINPDAVIIAEIWDEADPYLRGHHFDTHMNYPFARAVTEWLAVKPGMTSDELAARLTVTFGDAPQTNLIHQNLFSSHDSDRYVSKLMNPGRPEYDALNRIQDGGANLKYDESKPSDTMYRLSLLGVAIQATYLGSPMVYYGDEVGMWGADDPSDRKPYPWPDAGPNLNPDDNIVTGIRDAYRDWFQLRHDPVIGPVLRFGDLRHIETSNPGVFAFVRSLNGTEVYVVANRDATAFDAASILPGINDALVDGVSARYWVVSAD